MKKFTKFISGISVVTALGMTAVQPVFASEKASTTQASENSTKEKADNPLLRSFTDHLGFHMLPVGDNAGYSGGDTQYEWHMPKYPHG